MVTDISVSDDTGFPDVFGAAAAFYYDCYRKL